MPVGVTRQNLILKHLIEYSTSALLINSIHQKKYCLQTVGDVTI